MSINILGVKIDKIEYSQLWNEIKDLLKGNKRIFITTPNPEILLEAQRDEEFFYILNKADFSLADGTGLKIASWFLGENLKIISGSDLIPGIFEIANANSCKVAIILWEKGLTSVSDLDKKLKNKFTDLDYSIFTSSKDYKNFNIEILNAYKPDILIVALGAPYQEKFIYHIQNKINNLKLSIGVGGGIDFFVGTIKRSPKLFRIIGLEWLWRLIKQPWRWKRIYNAVFVFLFSFLKQKYINKLFYRKNVVAFIYQNDEVLILNWAEDNDYWGLPQGGVDKNESYEEALKREIREETGIIDYDIIKKINNAYKYKWPKHYYHTGYKGQKQTLFFVKYNGSKNDIKLCPYEHKDFKWVKIDSLLNQSHKVHEKAYSLFLENYKNL